MSGAYGLFHVFNELLDEKANKNTTARGKTMGAKSEIYQGSWTALNAWIETKLAKQKGAGISGFGCFCWELKQKGETTHCRPIFIMSDAFVKNFRVKRERIHRLPETTAIEEVNYSLLAIKFSNSLTKDMVFSGLRDTIKKIGDFIDRGYEIEIPFTFGTLRAKERRVKFEFSQTRLQEILPERIQPGTLGFGKAPAHLFDESASDAGDMSYRGSEVDVNMNEDLGSGAQKSDTMLGQTARRVGTSAGKRAPSLLAQSRGDSADATGFLDRIDENAPAMGETNSTTTATTTTVPNPKVPSLSMGKLTLPHIPPGATAPSALTASSAAEQDYPPSPTPSSPAYNSYPPESSMSESERSEHMPAELKELLTTLAKKTTKAAKEEFRNQARTRVLEQAYMRCLNSVEDGAHMDDQTTAESKSLLEEWRRKASALREKKHADQLELRKSLDSQMSHNAQKAEETRLEHKNGLISFILPGDGKDRTPAALAMAGYDQDGNPVSSRHAVSKLLEEQIKKNALEKQSQKQKTLRSERDYLDRLAVEIELHNAMDRSAHLQKQRTLLEAWERDGHIRNLKKLQPFGVEPVQDYIQRNLAADPNATSTGPLNYTSSLRVTNGNATAPASMQLKATSSLDKSATLAGKLNMSIGYDPRRPKIDW